MAYGSPDRLEDVPAYYADIRGGRPIKPEHLEDLVARYRRLGIEESNPLNEITEATRAALEVELGLPVFTGMRHWQPRIADAVERALAGGADESSASCWRRTTRRSRSRSTARSSWSGRRPRRDPLRRALGRRARLRRPARREACGRETQARRLHRALAAGADPGRGRSVPGRAARDLAARRRARRRARVVVLVPERVADRRAVARPGHPRPPERARRHAASAMSSSARSASSPTTSRSAGTSTSRRADRARELGLRLERIELPNADPAFIRVLAGLVRRHARCTVCRVKTGQIRVDGVSRRFRVHANEARSLKELFVLRGRTEAQDVSGARGRLARGRAGRGRRARRPQRLRQVDAAAADRRDHQADVGTRRRRRPDRLAARARRRLPPRLQRPRERLPERRHLRAQARADPGALRRDRRLRRARAGDRPARAHLLLGDVHAARLRDRRAPRRRHPPARRGLRGRRRGLPAQVLRQGLRVQAARRHDRLRLARRHPGRAAVRARRAPARGQARVRRPDARGDRPLPQGARRRGRPGRARRRAARVGDRRGDDRGRAPRRPRGAGAAAVPRRRAVLAPAPDRGGERDRAAAAPARAARRGRPARRVGRARHGQRRLGGRDARAALRRRPAAALGRPLPPAARARRRRPASGVLHWLDDALTFLVYPAGEERGVVRLEGSWAAEQNSDER